MVFSFWFVQWLQGNGSFRRRPCHCLLSNVCNIVHSGSNGSSPCNVQWHPWETLSLSTLALSPSALIAMLPIFPSLPAPLVFAAPRTCPVHSAVPGHYVPKTFPSKNYRANVPGNQCRGSNFQRTNNVLGRAKVFRC